MILRTLVLGLVLVTPASAEEGAATVYGAGAVSCGQWQNDHAIRAQAEAHRIDNYCRINPIDRVTAGVFALKNELLSRAR
jgi:hypothetical protein